MCVNSITEYGSLCSVDNKTDTDRQIVSHNCAYRTNVDLLFIWDKSDATLCNLRTLCCLIGMQFPAWFLSIEQRHDRCLKSAASVWLTNSAALNRDGIWVKYHRLGACYRCLWAPLFVSFNWKSRSNSFLNKRNVNKSRLNFVIHGLWWSL